MVPKTKFTSRAAFSTARRTNCSLKSEDFRVSKLSKQDQKRIYLATILTYKRCLLTLFCSALQNVCTYILEPYKYIIINLVLPLNILFQTLRSRSFLLLTSVFGFGVAAFSTITSLLEQIICTKGYNNVRIILLIFL